MSSLLTTHSYWARRLAVCAVGFGVGFGVFAAFAGTQGGEPKVGSNVIFLLRGDDKCFHVHHWLVLLSAALLALLGATLSSGRLNSPLLFGLGLCGGGALTDFVFYTDAARLDEPCHTAQPGAW